MSLLHLIMLALVQGVTEFLPISSSAHLILLPQALGASDQGLVVDVAVHIGTLAAVMLFFRSDVGQLAIGFQDLLSGRPTSKQSQFFMLLTIATIPVVLAGLILHVTGAMESLRSFAVIGWAMLVFGLVLYWADQRGPTVRTVVSWGWRDALVMGLWQAVALVPGTSRSGATITASRLLGFERYEGARISMLMSIPTIIASGVLMAADVVRLADWQSARYGAIAAAMAFVAAYLALALMMHLLRSVSFTPYVIYRVVLGVILLGIAYF